MFRPIDLGVTLTSIIVAAALAAPVQAQMVNRIYIAGAVSHVLLSEADVDNTGIPAVDMLDPEVQFESGIGFSKTIGIYLYPRLRVELEVSYFDIDIDSVSIANFSLSASGSVETVSGMVNVLMEFPVHDDWHPFAGVGVGVAHTKADISVPAGPFSESGSDTVLAYQGIVGIGYDLTDVLMLTGEYRYFSLVDPEYDGVEAEIRAHILAFGIRYRFQ